MTVLCCVLCVWVCVLFVTNKFTLSFSGRWSCVVLLILMVRHGAIGAVFAVGCVPGGLWCQLWLSDCGKINWQSVPVLFLLLLLLLKWYPCLCTRAAVYLDTRQPPSLPCWYIWCSWSYPTHKSRLCLCVGSAYANHLLCSQVYLGPTPSIAILHSVAFVGVFIGVRLPGCGGICAWTSL